MGSIVGNCGRYDWGDRKYEKCPRHPTLLVGEEGKLGEVSSRYHLGLAGHDSHNELHLNLFAQRVLGATKSTKFRILVSLDFC